jgi:hypothetical protein
MKRVAVMAAGALTLVMSPSLIPVQFQGGGETSFSLVRSARAEGSWKREFEEVCGKTDDSMNMTTNELKELLARCDKLKPLIDAQEETTRKVYLKRLQMCRDLLAYVYEIKSRN